MVFVQYVPEPEENTKADEIATQTFQKRPKSEKNIRVIRTVPKGPQDHPISH